jgi:hypothetical protein
MADDKIYLENRKTSTAVPQKAVDIGGGEYALAVALPAAGGVGLTTQNATIAAAGSLSGAVDCGAGLFPVALVLPAVWTAADITLQASADGTNYYDVYQSDNTEYTIKAAASRFIILDPADLAGVRYLKVRSGTSGTPVAQAAERVISVVIRQV